MQVSEILRKMADIVQADEELKEKEFEALQKAQSAEISNAVEANKDLQAGQLAQLVQTVQNLKQTVSSDDASPNNSVAACSPEASPEEASPEEASPEDDLTPADDTNHSVMVSPQQQELELLKKSQGIENHVEDFAEDEIELLKKMAGLGQEQTTHETKDDPMHVNPRKNAALDQFRSDNFDSE